jgi:hypothetical protein
MNMAVATSKELASIFRRGMLGQNLDEDEAVQYFALMGQFLNTWSVLFDLNTERHLPDAQWTAIRKDIITTLTTQGGRAFWDDVGRLGVHDSFHAEIEKMLAGGEESYKIV